MVELSSGAFLGPVDGGKAARQKEGVDSERKKDDANHQLMSP